MLAMFLLLIGCTTSFTGSVTGDVPKGASVVLLWPDANNLGKVGGVAEISNGKFELIAHQPDNQHEGLEYGTLVLYDGEPNRGEVLDLDEIANVVGAAPRHYIVDSNATCKVGDGCETDSKFERGMACGVCDDRGTCKPTNCKNVEIIATDTPLSLSWAIPDLETLPGVFDESGTHVAWIDEDDNAIGLFPIGGVGDVVFRTDLPPIVEITGVHLAGERIGARADNGFGVQRGFVRDFAGNRFLELDISGSTLIDGPIVSPDGDYAAAIWSDEGLVVYDIDAGTEIGTAPLSAGDWSVDWSPESQAAYAVSVGSPAIPVSIGGAVPVDYPTCAGAPGSSTVEPCAGEWGGVVGFALGHPVLLFRDCEAVTWASVPRSATPVSAQECAPAATGTVR